MKQVLVHKSCSHTCATELGISSIIYNGAPTSHGMHGFKSHNLGCGDVMLEQQLLQMSGVVVTEDVLGATGVDDAVDHGGMVTRIREDLAIWIHKYTLLT